MRRSLCCLCVLCAWMAVSCSPSSAASAPLPPELVLVTPNPNATATPTPFQPVLPSVAPTYTDTLAPTEAPTFTPPPSPTSTVSFTPAPTQIPPIQAPVSGRTLYTFYVSLDYSGHSVDVSESIRYTNLTGVNLPEVVLAVEPNLWANCFALDSLSQDGAAVNNYVLNGQRLTIDPAQPIPSGAVTTFALSYSLSLPPKSFEATFGYLGHQLNLTDWYPFIVPYAGGWVLHDPGAFGEHLVYDSVDFDVNLKVDDPSVIVAASAPGEPNGDWTHYHLEGARTFVLSASDQFKLEKSAVGTAAIRSYFFPGHENAGGAIVWMATQALGLYDVKFGMYPHPSLSVVETDVPDGQEYDGLVFLATNFYSQYDGTSRNDLITIGAHEIAHQWWFGLVGSDQALEPWLDEAMSVYSEELFYEYNYPRYGNWWWNFRVNYFGPTGYVDGSIYDYSTFRQYVNAVYLNGANFLDEVRTRIGDEAFFAFLKDYTARYAYRHATASDFFATLRLHTNTDISDLIQKYFQQPY